MDAAIGDHLTVDETEGEASSEIAAVEPFEAFYRREYRAVLGLAAVLSGNVVVAEDLTQEAFVSTLSQWDRVGRMQNPGAWVRRIAANKSISLFRRGISELKALTRIGIAESQPAGLAGEVALDVWAEVRKLPRRQAQAVALTYLLGHSRSEVAEILGCSPETVKTHVERARKTLAEQLSDHGGES